MPPPEKGMAQIFIFTEQTVGGDLVDIYHAMKGINWNNHFLQPTWFVKKHVSPVGLVEVVQFGAFSFCVAVEGGIVCRLYRERDHHPTTIWQVVCVLCGSACLVLGFCSILALLVLVLPGMALRKRVAYLTGYVQAGAVLCMMVGLLVYPTGLDSGFARHHCGELSAVYASGECQLGWGMTLAIVGTFIGLYCPILARFTVNSIYEPDYWSNLNYM